MNALRFTRLATFAWACAFSAGLAPSAFAEIVYTMTNDPGVQNGWGLSGTITVSGVGTNLGSAAITGWAYTVTKGSDSHTFSSNDSSSFVNALGLLATPTQLIVPYASDEEEKNLLELNQSGGDVGLQWTPGGGRDRARSVYEAHDFGAGGAGMFFWFNQDLPFPLVATEGWLIGTASPSAVPEIDPAGISSVLALVAGALGLLERRRLKTA